jgi:imidazolonepropionase-like amidohydrolase
VKYCQLSIAPKQEGRQPEQKTMRSALLVPSFLILLGIFCGPTLAKEISPSLVIAHATIIDTHGGPPQPDMTIVIRGDRIAKVGKSGLGRGGKARIVDGRGKFVIPGLWDMQVHLSWTRASALPLLVANGVTGVRDMGGRLEEIDEWRTKISTGLLVGPYIVRVGPMLNGKSFNRYQMVTGTPAEVRAVVRTLKFIGVDGLEIERRVDRDVYFALLDEAKREGLPLGGHIPMAVNPEEATDAGQTTIEHIETLFDGTFSAGLKADELPEAIESFLATGAADALFARFVKNRTAFTPDIAMYQWTINAGDPSQPPDTRSRYAALSARNEFRNWHFSADDLNALRQTFPKLVAVVGRMNRAGVVLLAGTDIAGPRIPGFSLHDELSMLVTAGLTPLQALQAATLNPAIVLQKTADFGSVQPGKMADLVLLDANPLENIGNTTRIAAVVLKGRFLKRSDLDLLLQEAESLASRN